MAACLHLLIVSTRLPLQSTLTWRASRTSPPHVFQNLDPNNWSIVTRAHVPRRAPSGQWCSASVAVPPSMGERGCAL
jgi:hypothetical protein